MSTRFWEVRPFADTIFTKPNVNQNFVKKQLHKSPKNIQNRPIRFYFGHLAISFNVLNFLKKIECVTTETAGEIVYQNPLLHYQNKRKWEAVVQENGIL